MPYKDSEKQKAYMREYWHKKAKFLRYQVLRKKKESDILQQIEEEKKQIREANIPGHRERIERDQEILKQHGLTIDSSCFICDAILVGEQDECKRNS